MNLSIDPLSIGASLGAAPPALPCRTAPTMALDMGELLRFKSMMGAEGQRVHLARMVYDRHYAYERIACAHASANDRLRRVALGLFQICHRRDEARGALA